MWMESSPETGQNYDKKTQQWWKKIFASNVRIIFSSASKKIETERGSLKKLTRVYNPHPVDIHCPGREELGGEHSH